MHFIFAQGAGCLGKLRKGYEYETRTELDKNPSMFGLPIILGGKDIISRREQISFLEKIMFALERFVFREQELDKWTANFIAAKTIVAACLYVQSQLSSSKENSALYRLINQCLGVTRENFLDEEDKAACCSAALKLVNTSGMFETANADIQESGLKFSEDEWNNFSIFLNKVCSQYEATKAPYNKFPVTTYLQEPFRNSFSTVGKAVGWVAAGIVSGSSAAITPRLQVAALIGNTLLVLGPASATSVALLALPLAERLITAFCTVSMTSLSGKAFEMVGAGAGAVVGLPCDLVYNLVRTAAYYLIMNTTNQKPHFAMMTGVRIGDGVPVINGQVVTFKLMDQTEIITYPNRLQITGTGEVLHNEQRIEDPENRMPAVIRELQEKLALQTQEPLENENTQELDTDERIGQGLLM